MTKQNHGKIIKRWVAENNINISSLSKKLKYSRRTIYDHFEREEWPIQRIVEYSEALNTDFNQAFWQLNGYLKEKGKKNKLYEDATLKDVKEGLSMVMEEMEIYQKYNPKAHLEMVHKDIIKSNEMVISAIEEQTEKLIKALASLRK